MRLIGANVVVAGENINVPIFTSSWIKRQQVLTDEELDSAESILSPQVVQIQAKAFTLVVVPNRVQLGFSNPERASQDLATRVIGGIVSELPHTPFTAVGLNFDYFLPVTSDISNETQQLFACPFSELVVDSSQRPAYGTYVSQDAGELGRLKIEVKPVEVHEPSDARGPGIHFAFNFHQPLEAADRTSQVLASLDRWNEALHLSRQLVSRLPGQ